jgi:phenylalanine-4-hydroxylase
MDEKTLSSFKLKDVLTTQNYESYTKEDHLVWGALFSKLYIYFMYKDATVTEFYEGLLKLKIGSDSIPKFDDINKILKEETGFKIVPVKGIVDDDVFFTLLKNRQFPVTTWLRKKEQLDYIEQPDMFHDLFGHVPFLVNKSYCDFLVRLGNHAEAIFNSNDKERQYKMSRLYWYTIEFGLLRDTTKTMLIYGSGIISSFGETNKVYELMNSKFTNDEIREFNIDVLDRKFIKSEFQEFYAYINGSLASLLDIPVESI